MPATTDARVAILLAEGLEECEALVVRDVLWRAGISSTMIAIGDSLAVTSSHDVTIVADATFDEVNIRDFDLLFLPGGMPGTKNLEASADVRDAVQMFAEEGKWVAAICAAPSILAHMGLLRGIFATANPNFQADIMAGGGELSHDGVVVTPTVQGGGFVTGQGLGVAIDFGYALVDRILGAGASDSLRAGIVDLRE